MIVIRKLQTPVGYMSCYSCGDNGDTIKSVVAYTSNRIEIRGKTKVVKGQQYGLILCKNCRDKLRELLT